MTNFIGLPGEFCPPENAAEHIAALNTIAEREAYWLRIPAQWHPTIGILAKPAIARRIVAMRDVADRQSAIEAIPAMWSEEVKALVRSFWHTRALRGAA